MRKKLVARIIWNKQSVLRSMQLAIDSLHQITRTIITNCLFALNSGSSFHEFCFWVELDNNSHIYHIISKVLCTLQDRTRESACTTDQVHFDTVCVLLENQSNWPTTRSGYTLHTRFDRTGPDCTKRCWSNSNKAKQSEVKCVNER